jgi:hypothetical protein
MLLTRYLYVEYEKNLTTSIDTSDVCGCSRDILQNLPFWPLEYKNLTNQVKFLH